nr:MAG TPA: hypothetical protein [Caudoviricetes sp.]
MKLIRTGVFETNSSSAHSLAYKNTVLRDYNYKPKDDLCFAIKELHLTKKPKEYEMYSYMPLYFDEYGWGFDVLSSPAEKLSYLMSSVYQYKTWGVIKEDPFFKQVIQWLNELEIIVNLPEEYGDSSEVDAEINHQSYDVVTQDMFKTKYDLLTYLFNNDIVIHIENDNSDEMQSWVDTPKETVDYRTAMYWCNSRYKCVRRKSWVDGMYLIYDMIKDNGTGYSMDYLLFDDYTKTVYIPTSDDKQASDWEVSLEVNRYEIS